jgi:hypothetical protein
MPSMREGRGGRISLFAEGGTRRAARATALPSKYHQRNPSEPIRLHSFKWEVGYTPPKKGTDCLYHLIFDEDQDKGDVYIEGHISDPEDLSLVEKRSESAPWVSFDPALYMGWDD